MVEKECNKLCNFFYKNIYIFRRKIDFSELQLGPSRATLNFNCLQKKTAKFLFLVEKHIFFIKNENKTNHKLKEIAIEIVNKTTEYKNMKTNNMD